MAWTAPLDWTTNQLVTAAQMDTYVSANTAYLKGVLDGTENQAVSLLGALSVTGLLTASGNISTPQVANAGGTLTLTATTVAVTSLLAQSGGYGYLGSYNASGVRPRVGADLGVAWNYSGGNREVGLWNTDTTPAGTSFSFKQLTGSSSHTDLLNILATGRVLFVDGAEGTPSVTNIGDENTGMFWPGADQISFSTGGTLRSTMSTTDYTIQGLSTTLHRSGGAPLTVNRQTNDGDLLIFQQDSTVEGAVSVSGNLVAYGAFVGAHPTQLTAAQESNLVEGMVVVATGAAVPSSVTFWFEQVILTPTQDAPINALPAPPPEITPPFPAAPAGSRAVYVRHARPPAGGVPVEWRSITRPGRDVYSQVATTTAAGDPRVYGVYLGKIADDAYGRGMGEDEKAVHNIAALGLHWCWATDTAGDLAPGVLLETSARAGHAQRQADDVVRASTLGKYVGPPIVWADVVMAGGAPFKRRRAPVVLYCG